MLFPLIHNYLANTIKTGI